LWSEGVARAAHESNTLYTVLIDSIEKPFCFLEINKQFVGVGFLDPELRESLYYSYREIEPDVLFLASAIYREFVNDTDVVASGTTYLFEPSGNVKIQKEGFNPHTLDLAESNRDVSRNYSRWPSFGQYDDLIRIER
jgi:hypothetical protein